MKAENFLDFNFRMYGGLLLRLFWRRRRTSVTNEEKMKARFVYDMPVSPGEIQSSILPVQEQRLPC